LRQYPVASSNGVPLAQPSRQSGRERLELGLVALPAGAPRQPDPPQIRLSGRYHRSVTMTAGEHDPRCQVDLSPAVALFRSLGDVTRLAIVHELARGEKRIVDLTVR
jgi:hypothetical protein